MAIEKSSRFFEDFFGDGLHQIQRLKMPIQHRDQSLGRFLPQIAGPLTTPDGRAEFDTSQAQDRECIAMGRAAKRHHVLRARFAYVQLRQGAGVEIVDGQRYLRSRKTVAERGSPGIAMGAKRSRSPRS